MFSNKTKNKFEEFGKEKEFKELEEIYLQHQDRFIKKLEPQPSRPKRLFGQNGLNYIQMALHRSKSLIDGVLFSVENNNPLIAILSTRAHFEVTGGVAYLLKKLENFYSNNINYNQLDEALLRLTIGSKDAELEKYTYSLKKYPLKEVPSPINILSMIEAADELFKKYSGEKTAMYRKSYDWLSEFCHPNDYAFQLTKEINKGNVIYYDSTVFNENHFVFLNYLFITASTFILFYDNTFRLLEENEELPIIVRDTKK